MILLHSQNALATFSIHPQILVYIYTRLLIAMPIKKATLYSYQCGTLHPYPVLDLTKKCEVIKASDIPVSAYDINGAACLL